MAKIKFRRDTAAAWIDANPVLAQGEPGFEHDTGKLKIGDGSSTWDRLDYANSEGDSLTDDRAVTVTVGNTEYFAIVNRANNDEDGVKASGVAYDSEGNMITLHVSETYNNDSNLDIDRLIISKFDNVGALLWQWQTVQDIDTEEDHDLLIDADDNIIVAISEDYEAQDVLVIVKLDGTDGTVIWQKEYATTVEVEITDSVTLDSDTVTEATFGGNTVDVVTVQFQYSTEFTWDLQETANEGETWTTIGTSVGNSYDDNTNTTQFYFADGSITAILDESGKDYRLRRTGVDALLEITAIALSGTDIIVAAEYEESNDDVDQGFLMKINATGVVQWVKTFGFETATTPYGMDVGADGDIVVVGVIQPGDGPGAPVAFAQKFSGDTGVGVWYKVLFGPEGGTVNAYTGGDVVIDSQNNIFISVNSSQAIVHDDGDNTFTTVAHVMKLDTGGETQWCRRIGPGPCASVATGIDCDDTGNVYLTALTVVQKNPVRDIDAYAFDGTTKNVLAVAKYSTAGAVLWQRYIESDHYNFFPDADDDAPPGNYDATTSRGRNMSIGPNSKLAIQVSVKQIDPDDFIDGEDYWESITFQIDQDGREMTVGSGNERFTVKASRIPGKFVTIEGVFSDEDVSSTDFSEDLDTTTATLTFEDAELAQQVAQSAPYEYVFGNDGTFTVPNDGDIKLTQTQIGWFSIFGPANNDLDDVWIRANCVDSESGDVYAVGQEDNDNRGFVARYNSQGQILWSIRIYDDINGNSTRCNAVKIHPDTGNVVVLVEYYGNQDAVAIVEIDPDTARVDRSAGFQDLDEDSGTVAYDFAFLSNDDIAFVGRKYDEWKATPVTPESGSTTATLVALSSALPEGLDDQWRVSGTGITGRVAITSFNRYTGLTGTLREGSGAEFIIQDNGDTTYGAGGVSTVGTNYLTGHKILIPGTSLGGATPDNDCIVTVTNATDGAVVAISVAGTAAGGASTTYTAVSGTNYQTGSGLTVGIDIDRDDGAFVNINIEDGGSNYVIGDVITIAGTAFIGGTTPTNILTVTVDTVAGGGVVNGVGGNGTGPTTYTKISVDTAVDFDTEGSWNLDQPLGGEAFVAVAGGGSFSIDWTKVLSAGDEDDDERYFSVAVDGNDNIYAAGEMRATTDSSGSDLNGYWCAVVSKFNSSGTHQWTKSLNDSIDDCRAKSVAVRGNTVVVTHENDNNSTTVVTKLDNTGAVKWQREIGSGDDSSVAIDTNGDIYVIAEAYSESQYGNHIRVVRFNSAGEIVWRKALATQLQGSDNTSEYFKNGRNLTLDSTHLYISGYTTAYDNNYENGFLVKIPKSGDQDGIYGVWALQNDAYDVDKINATEVTAFTPVIGTGEFELWEPSFYTEWWDPSDSNDDYSTVIEMRDRDGGAIEFADGTRQTTSAQQIPQIKIANGADHRLTIDDMGKHIYVTNDYTKISVPYHETDPLPLGYTVVIINNSGDTISIDGDGGGIDIIVPGVDSAQYWDLDSPGMATLIKVDTYTWFMTGNVTVD